MKKNSQHALFGILFIITIFILCMWWYKAQHPHIPTDKPNTVNASLITFSADQLAAYNGEKQGQPIYIGLDGYVYDVTLGKKFYQVGGTYHYIAGKDSSASLHIVGADIIKTKYPIVGILNK
jgi:predicted heme/steroid binding protein